MLDQPPHFFVGLDLVVLLPLGKSHRSLIQGGGPSIVIATLSDVPNSSKEVHAGGSYLAIQSGVTAFVDQLIVSDVPPRRPALRWTVMKLTLRYALLGFGAYVMIARLRLPPLGLLAGASSIVAAVAVEAVRLLMKDSSPRT